MMKCVLKKDYAGVAEQADAADSKSAGGNIVGVRFPSSAFLFFYAKNKAIGLKNKEFYHECIYW